MALVRPAWVEKDDDSEYAHDSKRHKFTRTKRGRGSAALVLVRSKSHVIKSPTPVIVRCFDGRRHPAAEGIMDEDSTPRLLHMYACIGARECTCAGDFLFFKCTHHKPTLNSQRKQNQRNRRAQYLRPTLAFTIPRPQTDSCCGLGQRVFASIVCPHWHCRHVDVRSSISNQRIDTGF
jgi:hypothetical protein